MGIGNNYFCIDLTVHIDKQNAVLPPMQVLMISKFAVEYSRGAPLRSLTRTCCNTAEQALYNASTTRKTLSRKQVICLSTSQPAEKTQMFAQNKQVNKEIALTQSETHDRALNLARGSKAAKCDNLQQTSVPTYFN